MVIILNHASTFNEKSQPNCYKKKYSCDMIDLVGELTKSYECIGLTLV